MDAPDLVGTPINAERLALLNAIHRLPRPSQLPCWMEPERWFSTDGASMLSAVHDCLGCPVRAECLAAAEAFGETHGVWGGQVFPLPAPHKSADQYRAKAHTLSKP